MITIAVTDKNGEIISAVQFKPNLNLVAPRYMNEGGEMGITRDKKGNLILMYYYPEFPSCNHGEYISEEEAYKICYNRGKQEVIKELRIHPEYMEE